MIRDILLSFALLFGVPGAIAVAMSLVFETDERMGQ